MYYTYIHKRKTDGSIFYVGKGTGHRYSQESKRSIFWERVAKKHGVIKEIHTYWDTEEEAFQHERELIQVCRQNGERLVNIADGGDGVPLSGEVLNRRSASIRQAYKNPKLIERHSIASTNRHKDPEFKSKVRAAIALKMSDPEHVEACRSRMKAVLGNKDSVKRARENSRKASQSPEYRQKKREISLKNGNRPPLHQGESHPMSKKTKCVETGQVFESSASAAKWVETLGLKYKSISYSFIASCCRGQCKRAYGFTWEHVK